MPSAQNDIKQEITFSDLQISNGKEGKKHRSIFIKAFVNPDSSMVFVAEKVKWIEATDENQTLYLKEIPLKDFPAWYQQKLTDGWTYAQ